jgi:Ni,Fe-hydrogenase maturation factor
MKSVYVFGNEFIEGDGFARQVASELTGVTIVHCKSPDDLLDADDEVIILDVVKGGSDPIIITDIAKLKTRKIISMHDFDVGFFLSLMKEMGMERKVKIIGIPERGNAREIAQKVKLWI